MISPEFYTDKGNQKQLFLGGLRPHFLHKERTIVIGFYDYELQFGETVFDLALKIFGEGNSRYWTVISDTNKLIFVDDWKATMTIQLPQQVIADTSISKRVFV